MADRYPSQDYGRSSPRGRFMRGEREEDDWRRRERGRFGAQDFDEERQQGFGGYGGGSGQGFTGQTYGGGYSTRREWDEEFGRGGGYGGGYGQGGMRGQSYGGGGYRSREDYDRDYGLQGSRYDQTRQSFNEPGEQMYPRYGQGGYQQTGQGWDGQSSHGPGGYGSYGQQGYAASGQAQGGLGSQTQGYRGVQQGHGGYGQMQTGGFGNQTGWTESGSLGQGRPGMGAQGYERSPQDFGGYEGSFGQGGYLTRGGRTQWGRHSGRGPKNYTRSDDRIREDINDRLTDDPEIDASEIEVKVSNCEVTLTGTVNDREDKRRAEDIAEAVSGVKNVQNNLRVQPSGEETTRTAGAGQRTQKRGGDNEQRMQ